MANGSDIAVAAADPVGSLPKPDGFSLAALFKRVRPALGFLLAIVALYIGWVGKDTRQISAGEGIGYWLGIVGGTLMLVLLMYSMRKRIPWLRHLGATKHWFRMHMTLGVFGPIIILYHSNFQVGSINSQVALYCTLLVAFSGVVGRYFYAQIHNGLYGSKASLQQVINAATRDDDVSASSEMILGRLVQEELAGLAETVLRHPESLGSSALAPLWLGLKTRWMYWQLRSQAYQVIAQSAELSPVIRQQESRLQRSARHYLAKRLAEIRRVAQFGFFEKLFSLWHIVHVPFFIMLVVSAIVHVIAVHMY